MTGMIEIHGHRGSRGTHPENTLPSFIEARDAGAQAVELDVHLSKDGHLVVFHDYELNGVLLSELRTEQILTHEVAPGVHVPTFEDVVLWKIKEAPGLYLNVEIKRDVTRPTLVPSAKALSTATLDLLSKHGLLNSSLVQSFDFEVVREVRRQSGSARLSCLFEDALPRPEDYAEEALRNGAQVADLNFQLLTSEVAREARARSIALLSWTVNEESEWARLAALGVSGLITDFPRRLSRYISNSLARIP